MSRARGRMTYPRLVHRAAGSALAAGLALGAAPCAAVQGGPLVVGLGFGVVPFGQINADGEQVGFSIDLAQAIAERLGRPGAKVMDVEHSGMFAALFSKRFEFIISPLVITRERAGQMLYTEPYLAADSGFLIAKDATMNALEDLRGKVLAVADGTQHERWATEHAAQYGFEVSRYANLPETIEAVASGRAFATVNESPAMVYAAAQNDRVKVGFIDHTGDDFGLAFRKNDVAFRNEIERILECMKLDGSLQEIYLTWFGAEPDPRSSTMAVYVGYGAPGFEGYEPTPHVPQCQ